MDFDMEKMTINQLKERAKDVDETAKRRGSKAEDLYKSILSNSSGSPIKVDMSPEKVEVIEEPKSFDKDELMRRVESMSYHERINYVR